CRRIDSAWRLLESPGYHPDQSCRCSSSPCPSLVHQQLGALLGADMDHLAALFEVFNLLYFLGVIGVVVRVAAAFGGNVVGGTARPVQWCRFAGVQRLAAGRRHPLATKGVDARAAARYNTRAGCRWGASA
ncbi:hypothetical protein PEC18_37730, partial [Paucibacter sp. O1-1]|nr:hypothetical protein [Paucibacter sp. O1-1]MDA3831375.1 hypothetical protein [Paucibacter sp. O1-1]